MKCEPETTAEAVQGIEAEIGSCLETLQRHDHLPRVWARRLTLDQRFEALRQLVLKLGERYERADLTTFAVYDETRQRPVIEALEQFAVGMPARLPSGGGLILKGKPGTGKDHLLAALLKIAVVRYGFTADWWDCLALFREVRLSISEDRQRELLRELHRPQILALSDPQPPRGHLSDWQVGIIRDAVDTRYRSRKSTWLTTNVQDVAAAEDLFTAPLVRRLKENSLQLTCDWESYSDRTT